MTTLTKKTNRCTALLAAGCWISLTLITGCGWFSSQRPVAVTGTVRMNHVPLTSGVVNFRAANPNRGSYAFGMIDKAGRYTAETPHVGAGMLPGKYLVAILAQADPAKYSPEELKALVGPGKPGIPLVVPESVTDPAKSGLNVTIMGPGPQEFDLDLEGIVAAPGK